MSFNQIWFRPEDPDSRSFRWREARRRLHEAKQSEIPIEDRFRPAPMRDTPDFTEAGDDLEQFAHSMFKPMLFLCGGIGLIIGGTITALIIGGING